MVRLNFLDMTHAMSADHLMDKLSIQMVTLIVLFVMHGHHQMDQTIHNRQPLT